MHRLPLFYMFLIVNKVHEKTKTNHVLIRLLILPDVQACLWLVVQAHWLLLKPSIFKNLSNLSMALQFLANVTQTGVNSVFVGDKVLNELQYLYSEIFRLFSVAALVHCVYAATMEVYGTM